ncbi:MAG: choice-of-anchor Q domain-containing protein, partial [Rhodanobacteraceae bacterium]
MRVAPHRFASLHVSGLRRTPLAICLGALLAGTAIHAGERGAPHQDGDFVLMVTNCNDDGEGSLRATLRSAISDTPIGFSDSMGCSQITLTSGAIVMHNGEDGEPLAIVEITGPGRNALTIDGGYADRVFVHDAGSVGVLTLSGLKITHGRKNGSGGCVLAYGSVNLTDVEISECTAGYATARNSQENEMLGDTAVRGGGLYAAGSATLDTSFVGDNLLYAQTGYAYGAGVFAGGGATLTATTISGNYVHAAAGAVFGGGLAAGRRSTDVQADISLTASSISNNGAFSDCDSCPVRGAGVWVFGNSTFADSVLSGNSAFSVAHYGTGGGLYFTSRFGSAPVTATLTDTDVSSNSADDSAGGIGAGGDLVFTRGTISGNSATQDGGAIAMFGGDLNLVDSLVTGNIAGERGGGLFMFGYGDMATSNSTISENMAKNGGGIGNTYGTLHLANSTIAFNSATDNGGGVYQRYPYYGFDMQSTIVASNSAASDTDDLSPLGVIVTGANNLVMAAPGADLPSDTLRDDPLLQPLADSGGPTLIHALLAGSPAIDTGNNAANLDFDQRGDGFVRVSGSAADIGAFELQAPPPIDEIFADGFET